MTATMPAEPTPWLVTVRDTVSDALSSGLLWIGVGIGVAIVFAALAIGRRRHYRASSMTVSLPFGLGSVTYESSSVDRMIAWKMYVQLKTRKAALPFDESNDVVADIYSSLYELFAVTRELLSDMRLDDIARPKGVADVILRTLNDGLRPHLTKWNACYRRWWEQQLAHKDHSDKTPQQIQQLFPQYRELVEDLKRTNTELSRFADELLAIARADRSKPTMPRAAPTAPTTATLTDGATTESEPVGECGAEPPTTPYDSADRSTSTSNQGGAG